MVETYRERARERAKRYSWDAVATAYEQLLLDVSDGTGHGPLPLDRLDEIERATGAALAAQGSPCREIAGRTPRSNGDPERA